jgi:hypothetical protein
MLVDRAVTGKVTNLKHRRKKLESEFWVAMTLKFEVVEDFTWCS